MRNTQINCKYQNNRLCGLVYRKKNMYINKYHNTKMYTKGSVQDTKECHLVTYTIIY